MVATLAAFLAEEGEVAEEAINPVLPVTNELVWGAIAFFLLLILMWTVCLPPIRAAMRSREEQVRSDEEAAAKALAEAEGVRRDYDATIAEARSQAAAIIDEARQAAEAERLEVVGAAEAEANEARSRVAADVAAQREAALAAISADIGGLATAAASKVVNRTLDPVANQSIVDAFVTGQGN